ncbi:MAG TPA: aryl-sulfate sulfohydrolase [Verrucomicrobiales bacterium]|nr:aryl-sulfate sulfohydrolase [Verrucomicrobiales bacterium]
MKFIPILFALLLPLAAKKPNIILIYTDDHGWPDIGPAGIYDDLKTPHLDALAASGVRVTDGYSSAPQCVPSRAGLLTGKYQNRFGVESNRTDLIGFNKELTIAERLKKVGYTTGQIGKWHLGRGNAIDQHGFDYFYNKNRNAPCHANFNLAGELVPTRPVPHTIFHLDDCSRYALSFIRKQKDNPFFLYLAYRAPHVPLDAPEHHLDRFPGEMPERRRQALAMIASMDDGVGAIVAELKKLNLTEQTLIFYIGDNGAPLKIHKLDAPGGGPGWDGSLNKPMNGEKGMLAEGGIRVPFLISWPGTLPATTYQHPIIALDATATALSLAGIEEPSLDGINIISHLKENTAPNRSLKWRWVAQAAIRKDKWKFLVGGKRQYLFDLENDPGEMNNLINENPETAKSLREQLTTWSNTLSPAGLTNGAMSPTWENYYDFYLDGKKVAPPKVRKSPHKAAPTSKATTRGATNKSAKGILQIKPNGKQAPFLVKNGVKLNGDFTATIKIRSPKGGTLGVAFRKHDEQDFGPGRVSAPLSTTPDWQEVTLKIPCDGTAIHLRFHLPNHPVEIDQITLTDEKASTKWNPGKN